MRGLLLLLITLFAPAYQATTSSGSVELDEISFDKIINKFDVSLVKFDVAFPYGDKHDAYVAIAKDAREVDEFLVAEVGVKDYGEKENEALAKKYGANKDNFPVVKLFLKGKSEPLTFDDSKGFTSDELRRFVREHSGLYLSLPGCVREFDKLAIQFMKENKDNRQNILKDFDNTQKKTKDIPSGKVYKTIMEKILEKGDEFVHTEYERVKKILSGKVSDEKKKELATRINILQTFQLHDKQNKVDKQEL